VPIASMKELVDDALEHGYGIAAINIVDGLSLQAVVDGAVETRSPLIVQTSVKTVRSIGLNVVKGLFDSIVGPAPVPVALHLDHCPDRAVISACLEGGWNSVLFDASALPVEENQRQTIEVVAEARRFGAHVEGEIEGITGVEDGVGSDDESERQTLEVAIRFIEATGIDVFAPAIGNAHGVYRSAPDLDFQRVSDLSAATGVPMALHGGTGLSVTQFQELISRGCAKVNISTALKMAYMAASLEHLEGARSTDQWDPPALFAQIHAAVKAMAIEHMELFGSTGRA